MCNEERNLKADLTVIQGRAAPKYVVRRDRGALDQSFPEHGNLTEAILYPVDRLVESAMSVGRGTDTPFEVVGAPYIDCEAGRGTQFGWPARGAVRANPVYAHL